MSALEGQRPAAIPRRVRPMTWGGRACAAAGLLAASLVLGLPIRLPTAAAEIPPSSVLYPPVYYPDSPDSAGALPVTLRSGETSSPLVLSPAPTGGTLTLRVLDEAAAPISGILVEAVRGAFSAVALTGEDGRAAITGIPAGEAIVRTRPDDPRSETGAWSVRYAPGVGDPTLARKFEMTDRQVTDAGDLHIPEGARIKAVVQHPNGQPWFDIPAVLRPVSGSSRYERRTDALGRVAFGGLEPGSYRLWVDARGTNVVTECSDGTRDTSAAAPIDVIRGSLVSGIVIATDRGGEARGAIRDLSSNKGLPGVEVRFRPVSSPAAEYRFVTDGIGFYFAYGLPTGEYKIYVPAIRRWYPSAQTEEAARTIAIAEGAAIDGADVRGELDDPCRLAPQTQGVIEGGVQADFDRLPSAEILAWDGPDTFRIQVKETSIFRIACLPAGSYFVSIIPDGVYRRQYHPLTYDRAAARAVTVTTGDTTRGVNFFPELGVAIVGSVISDADGIGIADVPVFARSRVLGAEGRTVSDKDGLFRIDRIADRTGLPAGEWIVGTDSLAASYLVATPIFTVALAGERIGDRARLVFLIPEGIAVHGWFLERVCGGADPEADPMIVADASSHAEGVAAREYAESIGARSCRYRLTVETERLGEGVDLRSEWFDVAPAAGGTWSLAPHPWNGRGSIRLPRAAAPQEEVELYGADGTRIARLAVDGGRVAFDEGQMPSSGVYFLRYRGADGRDHATRLVLKR